MITGRAEKAVPCRWALRKSPRRVQEAGLLPGFCAALAASAFLAVGVTGASSRFARYSDPSAESACNRIASGIFSHLPPPLPALPASQPNSRSHSVRAPAECRWFHRDASTPPASSHLGSPAATRARPQGQTAPGHRARGCSNSGVTLRAHSTLLSLLPPLSP